MESVEMFTIKKYTVYTILRECYILLGYIFLFLSSCNHHNFKIIYKVILPSYFSSPANCIQFNSFTCHSIFMPEPTQVFEPLHHLSVYS